MTKTVKELIQKIKKTPNENEYYIANVDDLDEIKRAYENEIVEKDRQIEELQTIIQIKNNKIFLLKNQPKLYKEDFIIYSFGCDKCTLTYSCKNKCKLFWALKDNSKYDKLLTKEEK